MIAPEELRPEPKITTIRGGSDIRACTTRRIRRLRYSALELGPSAGLLTLSAIDSVFSERPRYEVHMPFRTSRFLRPGFVYTRAELAGAFGIVDASLNNGIFRPKGHDSIWLFVTRDKTPDRTQYADALYDTRLVFPGQTEGRTDPWIIDHVVEGTELLLFYRTKKYEHPGAGFRFEGEFEYVSHTPGKPSTFELHRVRSSH